MRFTIGELAYALGRGYWSAAARVTGEEAWGSAVLERARARRLTTDLVALLVLGGLLWLTFLPVHLPWADAPSAPSMGWSRGALALLHLLSTARRQGWVDGHDHRTAGALLNAVLSLVGVPLPRARRDSHPALPSGRHKGGERCGRADEKTQG